MEKWEYRVVHFDTVGGGLKPSVRIYDSHDNEKIGQVSDKPGYVRLIASYLTTLGNDGWEVVIPLSDWSTLVPPPMAKGFNISSPTILLRRRKTE